MSAEHPEALLKSALEKIVYFEARSEQLYNDLAAARSDVERVQRELADASQREIELRRTVAGLEVELSRSHREKDELARMNAALRGERAALLEKLIEASRIHRSDAPGSDDELDAPFDLAGFIAQLRSEAQAAQRPAPGAPSVPAILAAASPAPSLAPALAPVAGGSPAPAPAFAVATSGARPSSTAGHAERLRAEGRLRVTEEELGRLAAGASFTGRVEETVFGFSVRELSAPDAAARVRAADRLRALGQAAAAPALATALHAEREPNVLVALLHAFSEVASTEGVPVILPLLGAPHADVRLASLKTLLTLDPTQAGPHLTAAMKDPDRAVRRRASLLALGLTGEGAVGLGEQAVRDGDAEVRSLGALVLGAGGGDRARTLLLEALRDPEKKVRRAAAQSLSRILGEDVSAVVDLDDAQRRREVRRLSSLPARPVIGTARASVVVPVGKPEPAAPVAPPRSLEPLCAKVTEELRIALRGRSEAELMRLCAAAEEDVQEACALLISRGHAVRRGTKVFAA